MASTLPLPPAPTPAPAARASAAASSTHRPSASTAKETATRPSSAWTIVARDLKPPFKTVPSQRRAIPLDLADIKRRSPDSQTEDLEKTSTNRSMFINCISSGTNEGDDSGFLDDVSSKRSSKHKKQLLPKSLSAHQQFSKNLSNVPDQGKDQEAAEDPPKTGTPGSWPGELVESSLQSPMISEDRTTAVTPSDFVHVTEDSVSEVDALPAPSPAAPPENFSQAVSTSQVSFTPAQASTEKHLLPDTSHTANTQCESTTAHTEPVTLQTVKELNLDTNPDQSEASENEQAPQLSEDSSSNPDARERRSRNTVLIQQAGRSSGLSKTGDQAKLPEKAAHRY
ncbi:serine-rich coiled-coil domain-containing protein 1-like [Carassius auratus]|uniref:Serine-rich coiled-coil domain-containing protein 1-like n=1 Tax=Carassius auratus TaxID=7957 RepID=A0A6P6PX16_CARAU|nr:serine-rich coiled-coil domain-containing protein 1-like [Carassius auratus]